MLASPTVAKAASRQSSRKGKRAWRKNVDISDVQQGLDLVRDEIDHGGLLSERPAEDLFTIDSTGTGSHAHPRKRAVPTTRAEQIVLNRSSRPAVSTHKKQGSLPISKPVAKRKRTWIDPEAIERLRQRTEANVSNTGGEAQTIEADLWSDENGTTVVGPEKKHTPKAPVTIRRRPISMLHSGFVPPVVGQPTPASSYNPTFEEWSMALSQAEADAVQAQRSSEQQTELKRDVDKDKEHDDLEQSDTDRWEGFASEGEGPSKISRSIPRRKTPAERNRSRRRKAHERELKHLSNMQSRGNRVHGRQQTNEEVKSTQIEASEGPEQAYVLTRLRRRNFGTMRIPEPRLEVVLPDELQESLRLLRPEGNMLQDRYRNVLLGGRMEARRPEQQHKKARMAETVKWTYKDFTVTA